MGSSWLDQLGVAGDGLADPAEVADFLEEVEAGVINDATLSKGDSRSERDM